VVVSAAMAATQGAGRRDLYKKVGHVGFET
jgi:hypothetical protein